MLGEQADAEGLGLCLFLRASLAPLDGDNEAAIALFAECAKVHEAAGNPFLASVCASVGGMVLSQEGRYEEAEERLNRGLLLAESIANDMLLAHAQVVRGFARLGRGRLDDAWGDMRSGARFAHACSNPEILAFACDGLAAVMLMRGIVDDEAAALVGAAYGLRERAGIVPWPAMRPIIAAITEGVRDGQPAGAFERGWTRGRRMDMDAVLDLSQVPDAAEEVASTRLNGHVGASSGGSVTG